MSENEQAKLQKIADRMRSDIERHRQKDEELIEFIKSNPGGHWDFLVNDTKGV